MPHDAELIRRCLETRDEAAFRALVERHANAVLRTANAVTRDLQAAEDATQEAFLVMSRKLRSFDRSRGLKPWLCGIAFRCAARIARGRSRSARREEHAMRGNDSGLPPLDAAQRREVLHAVEGAVADLPAPQRAAMQLHYGEGLTHAEVAQALGIAAGTAKSRIGRALQSLRDALRGRGYSVALLELPALLETLPQPTAGMALVEACAAKSASIAVAMPLAKKLVAAAAIAGAATVAGLGLAGRAEPAPREARAHATDATPPARVAPPVDGDVAAPDDAADDAEEPTIEVDSRAVAEPAGQEGASVTIAGKRYPIKSLPKGVKAIVGPDGKAAIAIRGGTNISAGGGAFGGFRLPKTKFQQAPRHYGAGVLRGRVVDADGTPIAGAEVFRIAPEADRSESTQLSYEWLDEVAKTGPDGRFEAPRQKHGAFQMVANFQGLLNIPSVGMETKAAIPVRLAEGGAADGIVLKVPVHLSQFGRLKGRVLDEDNRPVPGGALIVNQATRKFVDKQGRFDAGLLKAGPVELRMSRTGYEDIVETVEVHAGADTAVTLRLVLSETGSLRIAGTVLDDASNPVPWAHLFLTRGNGTVRQARSDAQGRYAFDKLPDELADGDFRLHVWPPDGYRGKQLTDVPMPADPYDIRVGRAVAVVFKLRSQADGSVIRTAKGRIMVRKATDGETKWIAKNSWGWWNDQGVWKHWVPVGEPVRLQVEAEHHEPIELEMTFAADPRDQELLLEMVRKPGTDDNTPPEPYAPDGG